MYRERTLILGVLVLVVVVRLLSFAYLSSLASATPHALNYPVVSGDSQWYAETANTLLTKGSYEDAAGKPLREWPPGYPVFLAAMKLLTGTIVFAVVVQILFSALGVFLLYRMASTLLPPLFALVPALLYALDPLVIYADSTIMTDGLFSALLLCIVYLAFFQKRLRGVILWGTVGGLLGVATLMRPIAEFLVLVIPLMYLLRQWLEGRHDYRTSIKLLATFLLGCAIVLTPWMARNQSYFGSFEVSHLGAYNLLTYDVRGFLAWRALAHTDHPTPAILVLRHVDDPVFATVDKRIEKELAAITPAGENSDNYMGALAARYIAHDPIRYAYFHAVNTIPFFLSSSLTSYRQIVRQLRDNTGFYAPTMRSLENVAVTLRHPASAGAFFGALWSIAPIALETLFWLLVALSALTALIIRRREFPVLLFVVLVLYFAALTGPMAASRYRIPAEPYLLVLATLEVYTLLQYRRSMGVSSI